MEKLICEPWIKLIDTIYSSEETKAVETAEIIAKFLNKEIQKVSNLGEIDRSSTGFLERGDFEKAVDYFFSNPDLSYKGWETAVNAQKCIVDTVMNIIQLDNLDKKNILIVSHGGVGALLISHITKRKISRQEDQPSQGHYFCFDSISKKLIHRWKVF